MSFGNDGRSSSWEDVGVRSRINYWFSFETWKNMEVLPTCFSHVTRINVSKHSKINSKCTKEHYVAYVCFVLLNNFLLTGLLPNDILRKDILQTKICLTPFCWTSQLKLSAKQPLLHIFFSPTDGVLIGFLTKQFLTNK